MIGNEDGSVSGQRMDNGKEPKRTPTIASFFRSVPVEEKEKSPGVQCKAVPAGKPKHKGKWSLAWKTSKKVSDSDSDFEENGDRTFAVDPAKLSNTVNVNKREQKARDKTWPDKVCVEEELSLDRPTERLTGEQSVGAQTIKEPDKGTHAYLQESTVGSSSPGDSSMGSCEPKSNVFDILMRRKPLTPIESSASDLPSDELREGEGDCPSEVLNDSVVLMNDMPPSQEKAGHAADTSTQPNMFDVLMKRHKLGGTTAESKTVSSLVNDLEPDILCTLHEKPGKPRRKKSPKFKLCIRAKGHDVQKTEDINLIESAEAPETQESGRNKGKKKRRVYKEESPVQVPVSEGVNEIPDEKFGLEKTRDCKTTEESEKTDEATEESEKADEAKGVQGTNVTAGKMKVRAENKKDGRSQKTSLSQSPDSLDFETGVRRTRLRPRREVVIGKEKEESKELDSEIEGQKSRKKKPKGRKFQGSGASKEDWKDQLTKPCGLEGAVTVIDKESKKSAEVEFKSRDKKHPERERSPQKDHQDKERPSKSQEPIKLAAIFTKVKPPNTTTSAGSPEKKKKQDSATELKQGPSSCTQSPTKNNSGLPVKKLSQEEQEAANNAFNALFRGAKNSQSLKATAVGVVVTPAPWPKVSHIQQKPANQHRLWDMGWPQLQNLRELPPRSETNPSMCTQLGLLDLSHLPVQSKKESLEGESGSSGAFSDSVLKAIVRELSSVYPGVPLRKLFKRYRKRHEVSEDSLQTAKPNPKPVSCTEETIPAGTSENVGPEPEQTSSKRQKRARPKRRLSSEGSEKQQKVARKENDGDRSEDTGEVADGSAVKTRGQGRQKRGRKADEGPAEPVRRLSTRLQRRKEAQDEATARTSKRRRTEAEPKSEEQPPVAPPVLDAKPETEVKEVKATSTEQDVTSVAEPTAKKRQLWTERYQPLTSGDVMANSACVGKLKSWLEKWKVKREKTLRKELELQKRLLAKQKRKARVELKSASVEWWDQSSDSDFQLSDATDDSEDNDDDDGLSTATLVSGPRGVGKTAMVYACARELGYKVFEVNCGCKRSGKQIIKELEEATQSHLVFRNKPTAASAARQQEILKSPLASLFKQSSKPSEAKAKEAPRKKTKKKKTKNPDVGGGSVRSILKEPKTDAPAIKSSADSNAALAAKAASLILFEEVEITFEEDKGFWTAVNSFMQNAKCPIVMISTESRVECEGRYDHISLRAPSVNLLSAHLQLVSLLNNTFVNPPDLKALVSHVGCDIRQSLLAVQFWAESGGGVTRQYERPAEDETPPISSSQSSTNTETPPISSSQSSTNTTSSQRATHPPGCSVAASALEDESVFLSLSDWKQIKENPLTSAEPAVCQESKLIGDCSRGSMSDASETRDSQFSADTDALPSLPPVHHLLFESAQGLLNCVTGQTSKTSKTSLAALTEKSLETTFAGCAALERGFRLVEFCQAAGRDLVRENLSELLPLFVQSAQNDESNDEQGSQPQERNFKLLRVEQREPEKPLDGDVYDDGAEGSPTDPVPGPPDSGHPASPPNSSSFLSLQGDRAGGPRAQESAVLTGGDGKCEVKSGVQEAGQTIVPPCDKDLKSGKRCKGPAAQLNTSALDIFGRFADEMSFMDAFIPNAPARCAERNSAAFGWWSAQLKPGLTDSHVTARDPADWSTRDTRTSIRASLELACLDFCNSKRRHLEERAKVLREKVETDGMGGEAMPEGAPSMLRELGPFLPPRSPSPVIRWSPDDISQSKPLAARRKLYSSVSTRLPLVTHCNHVAVAKDYLPTLRCVCHSEKLREAANIKRRFLHYLDSTSFALARTTYQSLADAFLAR